MSAQNRVARAVLLGIFFSLFGAAPVFAALPPATAPTGSTNAAKADSSINTQCPSGTDPTTKYPVSYSCKYPGLNQLVNSGVASYQQCEYARRCTKKVDNTTIEGICVKPGDCEGTYIVGPDGKKTPLSPTKLPNGSAGGAIGGTSGAPSQPPTTQLPIGWKDPALPGTSDITSAFRDGAKPVDFLPTSPEDKALAGLNGFAGDFGNSFKDWTGQSMFGSLVDYYQGTSNLNSSGDGSAFDGSGFSNSGSGGSVFDTGTDAVQGPPAFDPTSGAALVDPNGVAPTAPGAGSNITGFQSTGETNAASQSDQNLYNYLNGSQPTAPAPSPSYATQASDLYGNYTLSNGGKLNVNGNGATYTAPDGSESYYPPQDISKLSSNDLVNQVAPGSRITQVPGYNPANETGQSVANPTPTQYAWYDPRGWFINSAQAEPAPNPADLTKAPPAPAAPGTTMTDAGQLNGTTAMNQPGAPVQTGTLGPGPDYRNPDFKPAVAPPAAAAPPSYTSAPLANNPAPAAPPPAAQLQGYTPAPLVPSPAVQQGSPVPVTPAGTSPAASLQPATYVPNQIRTETRSAPLAVTVPSYQIPIASWSPVVSIPTFVPSIPPVTNTTAQPAANPMPSTQYGPIATCPPGRPCENIPVVQLPAQGAATSTRATSTSTNATANATTSASVFSALVNSLLKAIGIPTNGDLQAIGKSIVQPAANLVPNPPIISSGGSVQLLWTSTGTQNCTVFDASGTQIGTGGSNGSASTRGLTQTTTFTLRCVTSKGDLITTSASVAVQ